MAWGPFRARLGGPIAATRRREVCAVLLVAGLGLAGFAPRSDLEVEYRARRLALVHDIEAQGVRDSATLEALRNVPRHEFVRRSDLDRAYDDYPLPIGFGQTISQPYIVGFMTEVLQPRPGMKVLEVGTGSGYQAAVLARIGCRVYTIEIFRVLADSARARLVRLGFDGVSARHGDGLLGWPEAAPFDAVIVTAAAGYIPPALVDQLKPGGRMVIPVGSVFGVQSLILLDKDPAGRPHTRNLLPVRFVPMLNGLR
jgi:protein-L-isoaspartate(D-aspartate) O-methyltransferase